MRLGISALLLAVALSVLAPITRSPLGAAESPSDSTLAAIAGVYESPANLFGNVIVESWKGSMIHVLSEGFWESVGFFSESEFSGVLREIGKDSRPKPGGTFGTLRFTVLPDGKIRARVRLAGPDAIEAEEMWAPRVPEALERVAPAYPEAARRAHVQGTVIVQALIGKDGLVRDCRILHSVPGLDEAAMDAVRQWRFKPIGTNGEPVATWVPVPVKFTLH